MQGNLVQTVFSFIAILAGFFGLLINFVEPYLPGLIRRVYCYGKFPRNTYQPPRIKVEIPKRWYKHCYVFAAPTVSYILYLVIGKYMWDGNVPKSVTWVLNVGLGTNRQSLVSPENTLIAISALTFHCWKRFYETHYVNVFSDSKMNIFHYMIIYPHYVGCLTCIIGESEGFVEGSEGHLSWRRVTYSKLICALVIVLASYTQLRTNYILSNLRKDKNGKVTSTEHKIPYGGLFEYISGALQISEITVYVCLSIILWRSSSFHYITTWVLINQTCTSILTHRWYLKTFKNYPKSRKILIPYLF
ncbi:polyprenal reductase-like [Nomia melanderi]|uniref:polyprenal reductase-like n=1 Tax=Nomia melanderi TaxID=2448451 RepID=UPI00130404C5|nr:polyprenol reductase-like [Nomia melanderi]